MKESEVVKMLAVLRAAFPDMKNEDATRQAWNMGMQDLPVDVVRKVVHDWIRDEEWPPKIAQIRKRVLNSMTALPTAAEAWQMVQQRIKNTYPGIPADAWMVPEIVQEAANDVGGIYLIRMAIDPEKMRERFERAYAQRQDKITAEAQAALQSGMKELT